MTPNASKQGKLDSFGAIFLFIFLPCMWGLGSQNDSPITSKKVFCKKVICNSEWQHQNIFNLFCNGPVPLRNGVVRPLFEERNVHLCSSDLRESRFYKIPHSEPRHFTRSIFGDLFDVMSLHQLHQRIIRNLICNLKI